jgi:hypothetical protein
MRPLRGVGRLLVSLPCLFMLILTQGCISTALIRPPSPSYSADEIHAILNQLTTQANLVTTLFCTGKLTSRKGDAEQEVNISVVGQRDPFQMKIEITHPWGSPIANLLLDEDRFTLVFFPEKKIFAGSVRERMLKRSFPVPLEPSAVWAFVRGYPLIPGYKSAVSPRKGVISLFDDRDASIQRLDVSLSTHRPEASCFPALGITQYYDAFEKDGAVEFAQRVVLKETAQKRVLTLRIKHALFNPPLPSGVFQIKKPKQFRTVELSREGPTR